MNRDAGTQGRRDEEARIAARSQRNLLRAVVPPCLRALALLALTGHVLLLVGCRLQLNTQTGLLDAPTLPALDPEPESLVSDEPSVTQGHDRRHWEPTRVTVAIDQVEYHPPYVSELLLGEATARQRREYPTAATVLETEPRGPANAFEAPLNVVHAGVLIVRAPFEVIFRQRWPWTVERGVDRRFKRMPPLEIDDPWRWIEIPEDAIEPELPDADGGEP